VAGFWTLAAFIFVQAYTSTLFTYVVAPVNHPLIDSMHDVAESTDVDLLIQFGSTMDVIVMVG
jgi:ionotropic glutamate receptor